MYSTLWAKVFAPRSFLKVVTWVSEPMTMWFPHRIRSNMDGNHAGSSIEIHWNHWRLPPHVHMYVTIFTPDSGQNISSSCHFDLWKAECWKHSIEFDWFGLYAHVLLMKTLRTKSLLIWKSSSHDLNDCYEQLLSIMKIPATHGHSNKAFIQFLSISQCLPSWFLHIPSLIVCTCALVTSLQDATPSLHGCDKVTRRDKYGIFASNNMSSKIHHPTGPGTSEKMRSRRNRLRDVTELDAIAQLIGVILACNKKKTKTNGKSRGKKVRKL